MERIDRMNPTINKWRTMHMFDQEKTGKFIAENRRQKELTQKDLAEKLGISDKTVSKWETGHGMPDVSVIPELCEILSVNSNELLAGEKLESAESFSQKAEENVMELMKTNKTVSAKSRWSFIGGIAGLLLLFLYMLSLGGFNGNYLIRFIDLPSFCCVAGVTILILVASGNLGSFFKGIGLAFKKSSIAGDGGAENDPDIKAAFSAIKTAITANLFGGLFGTLTALMYLLTQLTSPEQIGPNVAVALITMFYGLFFAILLLPIRERLHR